VSGLVGFQEAEDAPLMQTKRLVRKYRCGRRVAGFRRSWRSERELDFRRQILPYIFPRGDQLCALLD
jgi:hypothetical protein